MVNPDVADVYIS